MKNLVAFGLLLACSGSVSLAHADDSPPPAAPAAPPEAPAAPPSPASRTAGRGVVIVALGEGSADAARALAREIYADAALRAPIDERTAQILCGTPAAADDVRGRELASLRAALDPDPASATTRRALESLAAELGARAVVAVVRPTGAPAPRAWIIPVGGAADAGVELAGDDAGGAGTPSWPGAAGALRALFPAPPLPPATRTTAAASPIAPRTSDGKGLITGGADAKAGALATPADAAAAAEDAFYERPWFWIALGAFAIAGVTAVVVSQTGADEPGDTVRFRATIPEAGFTFP